MPTRYYPAVKAPSVRTDGPYRGTWGRQGAFTQPWAPTDWCWRLSTLKTDCGTFTNYPLVSNQQGNYDFAAFRWMTPPLEAQSITGTLQLCFNVQATWQDAVNPPTNDSIVRWKIHAYLAQGQSTTVRTTLIDNYVDGVNFPGTSGDVWRSLSTAQTLAAATAQAGDVIVVEVGMRIVSSPTPTPTYPPTNYTQIDFLGVGVNAAFADATAGETTSLRTPWLEFSMTLAEQAASSPPANDECADAIVIPSLPYTSPFIDTTGSTDTNRGIYFTWTAPTSGTFASHCLGSNYLLSAQAMTGSCGALVNVFDQIIELAHDSSAPRCLSTSIFQAVQGTQYWFRLRGSSASGFTVNTSGGSARFSLFAPIATPVEDDLYVPGGLIVAMRDGEIINFNAAFVTTGVPTGVAIDYTGRPMDAAGGGVNTNPRLLVGMHSTSLVEILDLPTLSYTFTNQQPVDFIEEPWDGEAVSTAQLAVSRAGHLYAGWFGNGFLYVSGYDAGGGDPPAILNTVSDDPLASDVRAISAAEGDNQTGAPFADTAYRPTVQVTAAWALAYDDTAERLYYTSGGLYEPVGGDEIRTFNTATNTQGPLFATLSLQAGNNPGLKGMQLLPGGGLLVCNSTVVQRLNASGTLVQTYTPSIAQDSQALGDVKLTADAASFWVMDIATTRLFQFDLASGVELQTVQPYLNAGALIQLAIYQPVPPNPTPEGEIRATRRLRRFPLPFDQNKRVTINSLEILWQAGVGLSTGQGSDPVVMFRYSKDGGKTWSNELQMSIGRQGDYGFRSYVNRLGQGRNWVAEVTVSDPVFASIVDCWVDADVGTS